MPTYVYACTNPDCGHQFEAVQAFTDEALSVCPVCGQRLRKVFGSVGVVFKGSGFYRNDSREKAKNGSATSGSDGDKSGGPSESAGSDTASPGTDKSTAGKAESTSPSKSTDSAPAPVPTKSSSPAPDSRRASSKAPQKT